jgi:hypothetical protein
MHATAYERVTSEIANLLFPRAEGFPRQNVLVDNKSKWKGQSGFVHQIDVAIRGENDIIMVECKHWKYRNIKAENGLTFIARIADIRPTVKQTLHPVFVACSGFQSGCHKLAKFYSLDLEVIASPGNFAFSYKGMTAVGISPESGSL